MAKTVFDVLRERIEEQRSSAVEFLSGGSSKDYAEYRELCGVIRGLDTALSHMEDLLRSHMEEMMMSEVVNINDVSEEDWEAQLPKPVGYRLLVALPDIEDYYKGSSLLKTDTEKHREYIMSIMGIVIDVWATVLTVIRSVFLKVRGVNRVTT
jgi:hypothetical protein